MSIRVSTSDVGLASPAGQAEQIKPDRSSVQSFGKPSEDRIEVSAAAENINSALAAQNTQRSQRVQVLASMVSGGQYNVASSDISRAIVSSGIRGAAADA